LVIRAGGWTTGRINALDDVLDAAPNLRELALVGRMPISALRQKHPRLRQCALRMLRCTATPPRARSSRARRRIGSSLRPRTSL
jgi:hypothetical protein